MFCKYEPEAPKSMTTRDLLDLFDHFYKLKDKSKDEKEAYQHLRKHIALHTLGIKFLYPPEENTK